MSVASTREIIEKLEAYEKFHGVGAVLGITTICNGNRTVEYILEIEDKAREEIAIEISSIDRNNLYQHHEQPKNEYIFTITYNFDGAYVVKKCATYEEALKMLKDYLKEEIKTIRTESEYEPSVLEWEEDDVTLVYASGYTKEEKSRNYATEDCAYYRIFEV